MSYREYATRLGNLFCPQAGTVATKEDFYARTQGKNEPYILYLNEKLELFHLGWGGIVDFDTLAYETIRGLANTEVRNQMYNMQWSDWPTLTAAVEKCVVGRIHQIKAGDVQGNMSMEGLSASYSLVNRSTTADVNQVTTAATNAERCWDCGSHDHFHNSPHCTQPGARRFWPSRGRGRGQGGRGAAGRGAGGRGFSGRGRYFQRRGVLRSNSGSVNQVEAEQDVYVLVEDDGSQPSENSDFLGEASVDQSQT